ncbi:unnamed protein product [Aureobasidium uvarum]|uniref:Uncharacterized protein n=1 Tax=Aureobasidium uvarum TaxID=2773716 RepID=A0A9N8PP12_9PEZI|nr:unnamed protein product [Aureobasidium uvarum]
MFCRFPPFGKGKSGSSSTTAAPSSRSEQIADAVVPSSRKDKGKLIPPAFGLFNDDRRTSRTSRTSTSQDMIQLAHRPVIQPRRNTSLAPSTEMGIDSDIDPNKSNARGQDWRVEQAREIQNLAEHMREATRFVKALVRMLDAVEAIRKGHKKQFELPEDLATLYKTHPPIQEALDHTRLSVTVIADKVSEYADGVSEASTRVQKLARSGKTGPVKKRHGKNAEVCLVSQIPALLKAANVFYGLREVIDDCKFEGDGSSPRFGSRDDVARLRMREKELSWLMQSHSGWIRELQHLDVDS